MKHSKEISAIAIPAIISNVTTPLLGVVDVAISGHIGSAIYIGAIAVGGTMFNMLYWLFGFLRMGTGGLTAQAYGSGNKVVQNTVLWRALAIALSAGLLLILLSVPLAELVLNFMDADDATAALAREYFYICIFGAPAVLSSYVMAGWLVGMQNSRAAMTVAISTNVANIAVSATLVFGLHLKLEGVACGTLCAQWFGAALAFFLIRRKHRPERVPFKSLWERTALRRFFSINTDIFLRTCCLVAVTLWFTHAGARQSTLTLAANAILLQLFMLFSYFMDGYAYAGEALAGKYYGRGDNTLLKSLARELNLVGLFWALGFTVVYSVAGELFMRILSDEQAVIDTGRDYLVWISVMPLCGFMAFIWDGIYIGLTATRAMLLSMFVAVAIFFALYFALHTSWGNHALWFAFDVYLLVRGLVELVLARRYMTYPLRR